MIRPNLKSTQTPNNQEEGKNAPSSICRFYFCWYTCSSIYRHLFSSCPPPYSYLLANCTAFWQAIRTYRKIFYTFDNVRTAAWSPNGKYIASAGHDTIVVVWNVKTGEAIYTYKAHNGGVNAVAWSPDGEIMASIDTDLHLTVWEAVIILKK